VSTRTLKHLLAPFAEAFAYKGTTEVVVNECGRMMVEADGKWTSHDCPALTYDHLDAIGILAAFDTGQDVGPDKPLCITVLPGGERVQICRPPATLPGIISLTIRRPPSDRPTLSGLASGGLFEVVDDQERPKLKVPVVPSGLGADLAAELAQAVLDRKNILIAGATGSGKTTLLRALVDVIPLDERLITIEKSPELSDLPHQNRVALFYSKEGKLKSEDLLEASLSMRPDRVLMQELTDGATFAYLRSVVAGHPGCITTLHSNDADGAFDALRLMVRQHQDGKTMPDADVRDLLYMHVGIVVHCTRKENVFKISGVYRQGSKT
jgi:type IV secretion system protein VirB11